MDGVAELIEEQTAGLLLFNYLVDVLIHYRDPLNVARRLFHFRIGPILQDWLFELLAHGSHLHSFLMGPQILV
jgi:hypothetical protein